MACGPGMVSCALASSTSTGPVSSTGNAVLPLAGYAARAAAGRIVSGRPGLAWRRRIGGRSAVAANGIS